MGFWDPVGFATDGNVEDFKRRRQTELKHGRHAMLATVGYITPEVTGKPPGYLSPSISIKFSDVPNGLAAISRCLARAGHRSSLMVLSASSRRTSRPALRPAQVTLGSRRPRKGVCE